MEITVKTERHTAQELQTQINGNRLMCIVLGGDADNEYVIVVENEIQARLVRGMLEHLGVEEKH